MEFSHNRNLGKNAYEKHTLVEDTSKKTLATLLQSYLAHHGSLDINHFVNISNFIH